MAAPAEATFPTTFSDQQIDVIDCPDIDTSTRHALLRLEEKGLQLVSGLTRLDVSGILEIASTDKVREFCPNDLERFGDPEKWLKKGRAAFLLQTQIEGDILGYSWVGEEKGETTTAFRTTVPRTGADLVIATLGAARALHRAHDFTLETWASNRAAVRTYIKCGAILTDVASEQSNPGTGEPERVMRPTLNPSKHDVFRDDEGWWRYDTRLFMAFPEPAN